MATITPSHANITAREIDEAACVVLNPGDVLTLWGKTNREELESNGWVYHSGVYHRGPHRLIVCEGAATLSISLSDNV